MTCPYSILGLEDTAPFNEVRSRYIQLAKKHHPDKLAGKTQEEIQENEDRFKDITNAYHKILNKNDNENVDYEDWVNKIWIFFKDPEVWESMKDMMEKISKKHNKHIITVPITLEEIYTKKNKKLRLFLKDVKEPIFCEIDCSRYPGYRYYHNNEIIIDFAMVIKKHSIFRHDNLLNMWDLYTTIKISIYEYVNGIELNINYLDNNNLLIKIPPFCDFNKVLVEKGKGLSNKGDLHICYELSFPSENKWKELNDNQKCEILNALKSLG
jgi:DnaJ-class molecular chaperone